MMCLLVVIFHFYKSSLLQHLALLQNLTHHKHLANHYKINEKTLISVLTKYVGDQYMGNIDSDLSKLNSYSTTDINLRYQPINFLFFEDINFTMLINNIFGLKYLSNGYFYTFDDDYSLLGTIKTIEGAGYYPQAERNFLIGISIRF